MAEALWDLIRSRPTSDEGTASLDRADRTTLTYIDRLSTLSVASLTSTEPEALSHDSQSSFRSLQALSKRSHKAIDTADDALTNLKDDIPRLLENGRALQAGIPPLETQANNFGEKYSKLSDNPLLEHRKRIMRLGENTDRLSDILELPTLLSSVIAASSNAATSQIGSMSSANASYTTALDLHAHIKRLQRLYPKSNLVQSIAFQAEGSMQEMKMNLVAALRSQSLKLAGALRLIGLLRRVAPDLDDPYATNLTGNAGEGQLGGVFLACRHSLLLSTLGALQPLQELADQEFTQSEEVRKRNPWAAGQQTERYLKRYIEVFREQVFSMISMYYSIFPDSKPGAKKEREDEAKRQGGVKYPERRGTGEKKKEARWVDPLFGPPPPAGNTYVPRVTKMLLDTIKRYMPNVRDRGSRDSLFMQVLYCATSFGRLGCDFSFKLYFFNTPVNETTGEVAKQDETSVPEYMRVMKRHQEQASRLEQLASGASKKVGHEASSQA